MLLMVEEGIRGGICHSIHRYAKANNKYMKNYNNNEESSYIQFILTLNTQKDYTNYIVINRSYLKEWK